MMNINVGLPVYCVVRVCLGLSINVHSKHSGYMTTDQLFFLRDRPKTG